MNYCQTCGREAPTRYTELYQNIGILIMRFNKSIKGDLCKDCINKFFWEYTLITFFLGWWGIISFFSTLFILPNNIFRYLGSLNMIGPEKHASTIDDRFNEAKNFISTQLEQGAPIEFVLNELIESGLTKESALIIMISATNGKYKKCANCDLSFKSSLAFCPSCGEKLHTIVDFNKS